MKSSVRRLDEVCMITMGQAPSGDAYNTSGSGWPLIAGAGDFGDGVPVVKKYTTRSSKLCQSGDVILGIRASIGQKVVADREYCLGRGVAGLRPGSGLSSRYLWHWLTYMEPGLIAKAKGATFKQVNREDIGELRIALPNLLEQRRIAEVLDRADALQAKRREALARLDELTQSIFLAMFGDLGKNPYKWQSVPLVQLARNGDTINYGVVQPGDDCGGGIPLIRVANLSHGAINTFSIKRISPDVECKYKRSRLRGDEVLVSCVGSIGEVALADESVKGFNIARAVARIPLDEGCNRIFVAHHLMTTFVQDYFTRELRTVAQPTLNIKQLAQTPVPLPPLALQQEFARRVEAVERLKVSQRAHLAELDSLFTSLQDRAFSGRL